MSAVGKITASAVSATNENQFSLVNINADFSLVKVEAPIEYHGLGAALSIRRRENAERGPLHRTARKLGALFEQIVPPIQSLAEAYGRRVSEISASDKLKPASLPGDGPFASHVGFDGTSIYAAATSGHSAIGVHFLACLIAQSWQSSEAIALWVELVAGRKSCIENETDQTQMQGMAARIAAQQDISRAELAKWDASARAWLLSADEVKCLEKTQLRLITQNCGMSVQFNGDTYKSVMDVWTSAMTSLQKLILGMPQRVSKAALFLGVSAWHIYPDINVVAPSAHIKFRDSLVKGGGVITLGLQSASSEDDDGVKWSLSLSHMRYYGDPICVSSSADDELRITMQDFHMVCLGAVLGEWTSHAGDLADGIKWLVALRDCYGRCANACLEEEIPWLMLLCNTAERYLGVSSVTERGNLQMLLTYGKRKGRKCFGLDDSDPQPMFGFDRIQMANCSLDVFDASESTEQCISRLRSLAELIKLHSHECVIVYYRELHLQDVPLLPTAELATALPQAHQGSATHVRWIPNSPEYRRRRGIRGEESRTFQPDHIRLYRDHHEPRLSWHHPPEVFSCRGAMIFSFVAGDVTKAALYCIAPKRPEIMMANSLMTYTEITTYLRSDKIKPGEIRAFLLSQEKTFNDITTAGEAWYMRVSLYNLVSATELYSHLPGATISIEVTKTPLWAAKWGYPHIDAISKERWPSDVFNHGSYPIASKFSCIAMFEGGGLNIDPKDIQPVMAMSSGNSIFALTALLQDPSESGPSITRLLGNLGRSGIVMLVPPQVPLIRKVDPSTWRLVNHYEFDGEVEASFKDTSLHLSFTDFEVPLATSIGAVDAPATMLETLVSIHDREQWVADLDILGCLDNQGLFNCIVPPVANGKPLESSTSTQDMIRRLRSAALHKRQLISIDCWEEFLDPPETLGSASVAVVRAGDDWAARLATACMSVQKGFRTQILPTTEPLCKECDQSLEDMLNHTQVIIL